MDFRRPRLYPSVVRRSTTTGKIRNTDRLHVVRERHSHAFRHVTVVLFPRDGNVARRREKHVVCPSARPSHIGRRPDERPENCREKRRRGGEMNVGQQLRKNGLFFSHNPWIGYATLTAFHSCRSYFYTVCIDKNRVFGLSRSSIFLGRHYRCSARIVSHCTRPIHFFLLIAHRRFPF